MPFGAEKTPAGIRFALWAPTAGDVTLVLDGQDHRLSRDDDGWRRALVPQARAGSRYGYRIDQGAVVPDPASRFQPDDVFGTSLVCDPEAFVWSDGDWTGRPWEEAVIWEAHLATATPEGTFAALGDRLEYLRDLGVTAIELLPIADFPGSRNWGYDGVLPYAPDAAYGTPDDLKRLVQRAHGLGLMVLLDVVYNHFGPAGNRLGDYAGSFFTQRHQTPWGAGLNFDGASGGPVRDYFVHNALYWLEEFHLDGLRFDAVHAILDDSEPHIVAEIATRIRAAFPNRRIHLVLENEANEARWLGRDDKGAPILHDAQWNDDIHHCWHTLLTGEADAYYEDFADRPVERLGRCLAEGFAYQGEVSAHAGRARGEPSGHLPPSAFVAFLQNHDQIGNRALGERLAALTSPEKLGLAQALLLLSPQVPMLFMGEEWAASSPFQFFVDFADDEMLSSAVRDGRRQEFSRFAAFSDPEAITQIPDPTAEATFADSKLRWQEIDAPDHAAVLRQTRALLALRHDAIVPLTKTRFLIARYSLPGEQALAVRWHFAGGSLWLAANFGPGPVEIARAADAEPLWQSAGAEIGAATVRLPSWTAVIAKGPPDGQP